METAFLSAGRFRWFSLICLPVICTRRYNSTANVFEAIARLLVKIWITTIKIPPRSMPGSSQKKWTTFQSCAFFFFELRQVREPSLPIVHSINSITFSSYRFKCPLLSRASIDQISCERFLFSSLASSLSISSFALRSSHKPSNTLHKDALPRPRTFNFFLFLSLFGLESPTSTSPNRFNRVYRVFNLFPIPL